MEPLSLPDLFSWYDVDITDPVELNQIYILLRDHYVEATNLFRFNYSEEFLKWAITSPGWKRTYHLAIRSNIGSKPFVGFITAIPVHIVVNSQMVKMVEINFLCVHKKIRNHRMAPILIKEITRRANTNDIFQAVYTAGITLPSPHIPCQYYHRFLNPKKLIDIDFTQLKSNQTLARIIKLYKLPINTLTPGLRPITKEDYPTACKLLNIHLEKFKLYMQFTLIEFEHWLTPQNNVVYCYVVEDPITHTVTDMVSFYLISATILNNSKHQVLNSAYLWYTFTTKTPLDKLIQDILIIANQKGFDVFNCLDIHDNKSFIANLKFVPGNGKLNYYLYNHVTAPIVEDDVGLILL